MSAHETVCLLCAAHRHHRVQGELAEGGREPAGPQPQPQRPASQPQPLFPDSRGPAGKDDGSENLS